MVLEPGVPPTADLKGVTNVARDPGVPLPFVIPRCLCGVFPIGVLGRTNAEGILVDEACCDAIGRLSGVDEPEAVEVWTDTGICVEVSVRSGVGIFEVARCRGAVNAAGGRLNTFGEMD